MTLKPALLPAPSQTTMTRLEVLLSRGRPSLRHHPRKLRHPQSGKLFLHQRKIWPTRAFIIHSKLLHAKKFLHNRRKVQCVVTTRVAKLPTTLECLESSVSCPMAQWRPPRRPSHELDQQRVFVSLKTTMNSMPTELTGHVLGGIALLAPGEDDPAFTTASMRTAITRKVSMLVLVRRLDDFLCTFRIN